MILYGSLIYFLNDIYFNCHDIYLLLIFLYIKFLSSRSSILYCNVFIIKDFILNNNEQIWCVIIKILSMKSFLHFIQIINLWIGGCWIACNRFDEKIVKQKSHYILNLKIRYLFFYFILWIDRLNKKSKFNHVKDSKRYIVDIMSTCVCVCVCKWYFILIIRRDIVFVFYIEYYNVCMFLLEKDESNQ